MTCEKCRAEHEENEQEDAVPCDQTGEPCHMREVELLPINELAYELYYTGQLPGELGRLGLSIEFATREELKRLTANDADTLLKKLRVIHSEHLKIEEEEFKRIEGNNAGSAAAH